MTALGKAVSHHLCALQAAVAPSSPTLQAPQAFWELFMLATPCPWRGNYRAIAPSAPSAAWHKPCVSHGFSPCRKTSNAAGPRAAPGTSRGAAAARGDAMGKKNAFGKVMAPRAQRHGSALGALQPCPPDPSHPWVQPRHQRRHPHFAAILSVSIHDGAGFGFGQRPRNAAGACWGPQPHQIPPCCFPSGGSQPLCLQTGWWGRQKR